MKFKLLAPLRTDFSIVVERTIQQPREYAAFWDAASEHVTQLRQYVPHQGAWSARMHEVRFAHRTLHDSSLHENVMYRTLKQASLARPIHILELHLAPGHLHLQAADAMSQQLLNAIQRVVVRVYSHHIALVEATIDLEQQLQSIAEHEIASHLDQLEAAASVCGERLCTWVNDRVLSMLFDWLKSRPDAETYIDMTVRSIARSRVMWVTRTLIFEEGDVANRDEIIHEWLVNSGGTELADGKRTEIERIQAEGDSHLIRWLNYLFRENAYTPPLDAEPSADIPLEHQLEAPFCDEWEALLLAQYYYAALDVIDSHLTTILANTWLPASNLNIASLKSILEYTIRNTHLMLIQRHDNAKYYRRTVKSELDKILDFWGFEFVLVEPVEEKIKLCETRLQLLMQQEAAKSALFTDMILLGIGITGIFSTFLALAEFGRTMATDVNLASYDINSLNIIEWLAVQPTDVILVISLILSSLLAIVYLFFRQRQTQIINTGEL
jgi:type II secretory pathway component PulM